MALATLVINRLIGPICVYVDFLFAFVCESIPQVPRTTHEKHRFENALGSLGVVYGHKETMVWMQTLMPVTPALPGYDKSGWCCFESSVCSLQKDTNRRLDLGKFDGLITIFYDMQKSLKASRSPPVNPHTFSDELEKRKFTGRGDKDKVKVLYTKIFDTIAAGAEELDFRELNWGDAEAVKLACVGVRACHTRYHWDLVIGAGRISINELTF